MTPKEKANELGNKFYQGNVFDYDKQRHLDEIINAKKRSEICVNEIINEYISLPHFGELYCDNIEYWQEVKKEIEKL